MKQDSILIKDLPIITRLENVCMNVSRAHKIMAAIAAGKHWEAFDIAQEILNDNDAIIEQQIDKEEVMNIINEDKLKFN